MTPSDTLPVAPPAGEQSRHFYSVASGRSEAGAGSDTLPAVSAIGLTKRQTECLRFIQGYIAAKGYGPGIRQICVGIGSSVKSKASISYMLDRLEDFGAIRRLPNRARAIEILRPVAIPSINGRPLYFVQNVGAA